MTKNHLIQALKQIKGNPQVFIKRDGATYKIDEPIELAIYEADREDIYTFSHDRKKELGIEDECIVLWAEPISV